MPLMKKFSRRGKKEADNTIEKSLSSPDIFGRGQQSKRNSSHNDQGIDSTGPVVVTVQRKRSWFRRFIGQFRRRKTRTLTDVDNGEQMSGCFQITKSQSTQFYTAPPTDFLENATRADNLRSNQKSDYDIPENVVVSDEEKPLQPKAVPFLMQTKLINELKGSLKDKIGDAEPIKKSDNPVYGNEADLTHMASSKRPKPRPLSADSETLNQRFLHLENIYEKTWGDSQTISNSYTNFVGMPESNGTKSNFKLDSTSGSLDEPDIDQLKLETIEPLHKFPKPKPPVKRKPSTRRGSRTLTLDEPSPRRSEADLEDLIRRMVEIPPPPPVDDGESTNALLERIPLVKPIPTKRTILPVPSKPIEREQNYNEGTPEIEISENLSLEPSASPQNLEIETTVETFNSEIISEKTPTIDVSAVSATEDDSATEVSSLEKPDFIQRDKPELPPKPGKFSLSRSNTLPNPNKPIAATEVSEFNDKNEIDEDIEENQKPLSRWKTLPTRYRQPLTNNIKDRSILFSKLVSYKNNVAGGEINSSDQSVTTQEFSNASEINLNSNIKSDFIVNEEPKEIIESHTKTSSIRKNSFKVQKRETKQKRMKRISSLTPYIELFQSTLDNYFDDLKNENQIDDKTDVLNSTPPNTPEDTEELDEIQDSTVTEKNFDEILIKTDVENASNDDEEKPTTNFLEKVESTNDRVEFESFDFQNNMDNLNSQSEFKSSIIANEIYESVSSMTSRILESDQQNDQITVETDGKSEQISTISRTVFSNNLELFQNIQSSKTDTFPSRKYKNSETYVELHNTMKPTTENQIRSKPKPLPKYRNSETLVELHNTMKPTTENRTKTKPITLPKPDIFVRRGAVRQKKSSSSDESTPSPVVGKIGQIHWPPIHQENSDTELKSRRILESLSIYNYEEYQGERNEDKERHGRGRTILPNGDYYEGQYRKNKRHGVGLYVFTKNGARYTGQYFNNVKQGIGTFYYPDGSIYEGEWKRDKKEGYGIYMYANGDVYEGQWRQDVKEGIGYYKYKELPIKYMGTWRSGVMQGPGQAITSQYRFHGGWKDNMPLGKGVFTFGNESMLNGYYIHKEEEPDPEKMFSNRRDDEEEPETKVPSGSNIEQPEPPKLKAVWKSRELTKFEGDKLPVEPRPDEYPESEIEDSEADIDQPDNAYQQNIFAELSQFDKIYVDEAKFASLHSWDQEIVVCSQTDHDPCPGEKKQFGEDEMVGEEEEEDETMLLGDGEDRPEIE